MGRLNGSINVNIMMASAIFPNIFFWKFSHILITTTRIIFLFLRLGCCIWNIGHVFPDSKDQESLTQNILETETQKTPAEIENEFCEWAREVRQNIVYSKIFKCKEKEKQVMKTVVSDRNTICTSEFCFLFFCLYTAFHYFYIK